ISVRGDVQTPGGNIAENLASFHSLLVRNGDGTDPAETVSLLRECVAHVRGGTGPALLRLAVPRLCSHSGPDNQRGYRSDAEIAEDAKRDPLPRLKRHVVPEHLSVDEWRDVEAEVRRDVAAGLAEARARPAPDPARVKRFIFAEPHQEGDAKTVGGLTDAEIKKLGGREVVQER